MIASTTMVTETKNIIPTIPSVNWKRPPQAADSSGTQISYDFGC
jgi:hypothetical protein